MTTESPKHSHSEVKPQPFCARLQAAREARGFERKEAASRLRLNEKFIIMMEKDHYPPELPVTFIRGYLRSYGKLLDLPEQEIAKAVEAIKPRPASHIMSPLIMAQAPMTTTSSRFMQYFTYLIVLTLIGLVSMWWHTNVGGNPLTTLETAFTATTENMAPTSPTVEPPIVASGPIESTQSITATKENTLDTNKEITNHTKLTAQAKSQVPVEELSVDEPDSADANND